MAATQPAPIIVKRYGGHRLYDAAQGCYVSVDQLRNLVRRGVSVTVVDADTGADLTASVTG